MSAYSRTPPGTVVRLVIPTATVVAHGDLQMQVTLPDHPGQVVHLPLVDEHFEALVEVHPHAPRVHTGQTWRGVDGDLLVVVRYRADPSDVGQDLMVSVEGGGYYTPEQAAAEYGPLTLVDLMERPAPAPAHAPVPVPVDVDAVPAGAAYRETPPAGRHTDPDSTALIAPVESARRWDR